MRNENFLPVIFSEASVRRTNRPVRGIGPRAFAAVRHGIRSGGCRLSLRSFPKRTVASAAGECTKGARCDGRRTHRNSRRRSALPVRVRGRNGGAE